MKKTKLFLLSLLTAAITLVGMPLSAVNNTIYAANRDLTSNPTHAQNPRITRDAQDEIESVDYDTINIGTYDNNPIVWRVLNVTDGKAVLLADSCLCVRAYNDTQNSDWDSSTIKAWLNGNNIGDFLHDSFSDIEKSALIGDIVLPTMDDLKNESYGFPNDNYASEIRAVNSTAEGYWTKSSGMMSSQTSLVWVENSGKIQSVNGVYLADYQAGLGIRPIINVELEKLVPADTEYAMVDDVNSLTWQKDSGKDLTFTIKTAIDVDDSYEHFDSLAIDGKTLTRDKDYTATKGSTIITIKAATLEALNEGEHAINVVFDNGNFETSLNVLHAEDKPSQSETASKTQTDVVTPTTGDGEYVELTVVVMAAGAAAFLTTVLVKKAAVNRQ